MSRRRKGERENPGKLNIEQQVLEVGVQWGSPGQREAGFDWYIKYVPMLRWRTESHWYAINMVMKNDTPGPKEHLLALDSQVPFPVSSGESLPCVKTRVW